MGGTDYKGRPLDLVQEVAYASGSVVSKTLMNKPVGSLTLFAFDAGQGLSEHTSPYDAAVQILDGEAVINIGGSPLTARSGQMRSRQDTGFSDHDSLDFFPDKPFDIFPQNPFVPFCISMKGFFLKFGIVQKCFGIINSKGSQGFCTKLVLSEISKFVDSPIITTGFLKGDGFLEPNVTFTQKW